MESKAQDFGFELQPADSPEARASMRKGEIVNAYKQDDDDMASIGKRQQLTRNFGFWSMLGFTTTMMCTWEGVLFANASSLLNGGPVGMVYGFIFCFIGVMCTTASLAELASMLPVSGGQYHWVANLAPRRYSFFLSWITGWLSFLGWQAILASGLYLVATMAQGLLVLNDAEYVLKAWQSTLFGYAALLLCLVLNTFGASVLPKIEGLILILHILGFFAILIPLLHLGPRSEAAFVFADFESNGGWSSNGLTWFIGLSGSVFTFIGFDGPCHMAEEIEKASTVVPWCMMTTVMVNGCLGFAMVLAFLFSVGDLQKAMDSPTGYDFIAVFQNATGSTRGTTVMSALVASMAVFATLGCLASASRQCWALARDNALPFSRYLKRVNKTSAKPLYAVYLTTLISLLLTLIEIGSTSAFNALTSIVITGMFGSYLIPIVLIALKRLKGENIRMGPWHLGAWGLPLNLIAIIFCIVVIIFSFFPPMLPVTPQNLNWSFLVFSGAMVFGLGYYFLRARNVYRGPLIDRMLE